MSWTDETLRAWAAGFFDGEGSISAVMDNRHRRTCTVQMTVVQAGSETDPPDTLVRFLDAVGVGKLARRTTTGRLGTKPLWTWRATNIDDIRHAVDRLLPYLGNAKTEQIAKAMAIRTEFTELKADIARFCKKGHELTHRGSSDRTYRCWVCHNEYARDWKRTKRIARKVTS